MEKCKECCGFIESSCICALVTQVQELFEDIGISEYWISDIKYNYDSPSIVVENMVTCENIFSQIKPL